MKELLRLEPNGAGSSPNVIGGVNANSVGGGAIGATISGGGFPGFGNTVTGDFGMVSGGILTGPAVGPRWVAAITTAPTEIFPWWAVADSTEPMGCKPPSAAVGTT